MTRLAGWFRSVTRHRLRQRGDVLAPKADGGEHRRETQRRLARHQRAGWKRRPRRLSQRGTHRHRSARLAFTDAVPRRLVEKITYHTHALYILRKVPTLFPSNQGNNVTLLPSQKLTFHHNTLSAMLLRQSSPRSSPSLFPPFSPRTHNPPATCEQKKSRPEHPGRPCRLKVLRHTEAALNSAPILRMVVIIFSIVRSPANADPLLYCLILLSLMPAWRANCVTFIQSK